MTTKGNQTPTRATTRRQLFNSIPRMEWAQGNPRRPYYGLVAEPRVEMVRVTQNVLRKTGRDRQGLKSRLRPSTRDPE